MLRFRPRSNMYIYINKVRRSTDLAGWKQLDKSLFPACRTELFKKIIADSVTTMENTSCTIPIFAA